MRNLFIMIVPAAALSMALLSGCSDDDNGGAGPATPNRGMKPLPACEESVSVFLSADSVNPIIKRSIRIGLREDSYTLNRDYYGGFEYEFTLERGRNGLTYHFETVSTYRDRTSQVSRFAAYIPSCDEREEYQRLNPAYEEPLVFEIK